MYIISKFKDYYDSAVGLGVDKSIVYNRLTEESEIIDKSLTISPHRDTVGNWYFRRPTSNGGDKSAKWKLIGFCGKIYIVYELYTSSIGYSFEGDRYQPGKTEYFWGLDAVPVIRELYSNFKDSWARNQYDEKALINFINMWHGKERVDTFFQFKTPIFSIEVKESDWRNNKTILTLIKNPSLKEMEFFKVFDSYSAFQEVQMFISGVLGTGEKEPQPRTDIEKVESHGFDKKWSFRNRSNKK